MEHTLRAAGLSKDPLRIASAFGILVDKIPRAQDKLRQKIYAATDVLLKELRRAASESKDPQQVATAFGIVMDKQAFIHKDDIDEPEEKKLTAVQRKQEYKGLLSREGASQTSG